MGELGSDNWDFCFFGYWGVIGTYAKGSSVNYVTLEWYFFFPYVAKFWMGV